MTRLSSLVLLVSSKLLNAGNPVFVIATESHRKNPFQRLLARGMDVAVIEHGLFLPLDVDEALTTFMVNDLPDPVRFLTIFGDLLSSTLNVANASFPGLQLMANLRRRYGREVRRRRRYSSNTSRTS